MLDTKLLRNNIQAVADNLRRRGFELDVKSLEVLEKQRKALQVKAEELQAKKNASAKKVGQAKAAGEDVAALLREADSLNEKLKIAENDLQKIQQNYRIFIYQFRIC